VKQGEEYTEGQLAPTLDLRTAADAAEAPVAEVLAVIGQQAIVVLADARANASHVNTDLMFPLPDPLKLRGLRESRGGSNCVFGLTLGERAAARRTGQPLVDYSVRRRMPRPQKGAIDRLDRVAQRCSLPQILN
jgi:hypothetical protein